MKRTFPETKAEVYTEGLRADIVIKDIVIEVKGPTNNHSLDTLPGKVTRYRNHYEYLILVLFEPLYSESNYKQIMKGITDLFPNVKVIIK